MSAKIDQKAYLQKYLTGSSGDKKKKKKKAVKGKGFQIIDDDIDLTKLRPLQGDELDILDEGEDAPQIAGIVDERPEEVKKIEQFKTSSKWRVVNQDDGFNSKLQVEEIKSDFKESVKENEMIFGKMYSDSEDEKKDDKKDDSDLSPPRNSSSKQAKKSNKHNSDSDFSPPRKTEKTPPRKRNEQNQKPEKSREKSRKQSRWGDWSPERENSQQNESPIKSKRDSPDMSPPRKSKKQTKNDDSDVSPPRKSKKYESPPKSRYKNTDTYDRSRDRKEIRSPNRNHNSKYDNTSYESNRSRLDKNNRQDTKDKSKHRQSPPRKSRKHSPEKSKRHDSDSDQSPPRKRRNQSDSDESPPRKKKDTYDKRKKHNKQDSDSDHSPPRRKRDSDIRRRKQESNSDQSPPRKYRNNDSPPPSNKKMAKTLEGKAAGLQDARQLRQENADFRKREDEVFNKMTDEVSGRNAQVVSRKGKRETSEDRQRLKEKAERQKELDEKYKKWSKGVKQLQDQEERVQDFLHEASKPLARLKGDKDLEHTLKGVERDGDPMLKYIRERRRERGELGPEKPSYKGSFPPNRFNIRPGYRWDGVDRSNGYEKKYFETQSKKKAQEEEVYKWSTEDL